MFQRFILLAGIAMLAFVTSTQAADWPQWLGAKRDGVWREDGILDAFPKGGPKVLWRKAIGGGYTGPAVAGGKVFVMDRSRKEPTADTPKGTSPGTERVLCMDMATGDTVWVHEYDRSYKNVDRPMGPRTTPVVDGEHVYTLGSMGDLYCLNAKTGKPVWNKYFVDDYATKPPVWGYSAHLLVHGKLVIALVGGEGKAVVAFDKLTGKEVWTALTSSDVGYAAPVIAEGGGVKQLIVWLSDSLAGLNPETGAVYWKFDHPEQGKKQMKPAVTIVTPKVVGDLVIVTSAYDGALAVKLAKDKPTAEVAWRANDTYPKSPEKLPVLMTSLIAKEKYIYSIDANTGAAVCSELATGAEIWKDNALFGGKDALFGSAFWVENGEKKTFCFTDSGDLVILKLNPKAYEETDRVHVMDAIGADRGRKVIWSHPAFAEQSMIVRNEKEIIRVSLAKT